MPSFRLCAESYCSFDADHTEHYWCTRILSLLTFSSLNLYVGKNQLLVHCLAFICLFLCWLKCGHRPEHFSPSLSLTFVGSFFFTLVSTSQSYWKTFFAGLKW